MIKLFSILTALIIVSFFHAEAQFSSHTLPVISIETDSLNLWGPSGIYSNPYEGGIEWEKPCKVSFYENGILSTSFQCGIRIQGASSVNMAKKSFRLFFRSDYGISKLTFPIFGEGKQHVFDKLVLKSGYDDDLTTKTGTLLRDALNVELWNKAGGIPQLSRWVVVYLNNKYWGLYNLRESTDEHYVKAHTNYSKFDMVRFKNEGPELIYGSMVGWQEFFDFIKSHDLSNEENFAYVKEQMDIDNFLLLMAYVQCSQYYSWAWGSSMYRNNALNSKWKFSIWDCDRAYTDIQWDGFHELYYDLGSYKWANQFYRSLFANDYFKQRLLVAINDLQNTVFLPEKAQYVLDSIYNIIIPEVPNEIQRWNPQNDYFDENVSFLSDFLYQRPDVLDKQISEKFGIDVSRANVKLLVNGNGHIRCNILDIHDFPWEGKYYKNSQLQLTALPDQGYHFVRWEGINENYGSQISYNLNKDTAITAVFDLGVRVNNIATENDIRLFPNPAFDKLSVEFELTNNTKIVIQLLGIDGKLMKDILNSDLETGKHTINVDLENFFPGIYLLKLVNGANVRTFKIVKN